MFLFKILIILVVTRVSFGLLNLFGSATLGGWKRNDIIKPPVISKYEKELLDILESSDNRGRGQAVIPEISNQIDRLIKALESEQESYLVSLSSNSIPILNKKDELSTYKDGYKPCIDSEDLNGCWKLLYTSSPGTNSPIQRTFTSSDEVSVYQVININQQLLSLQPAASLSYDSSKDSSKLSSFSSLFLPNNQPEVSNIVCFGDKVRLRITALASTANQPLIVPRQGDGKVFGMNIFGVSNNSPPKDIRERIDFSFQEAYFENTVMSSLKIPYPVPFKLLGDEAKGWIDSTYLSPTLRVSRGNKGTIFILKKADLTVDDSARLAMIQRVEDYRPSYNRIRRSSAVSSSSSAIPTTQSSSSSPTIRTTTTIAKPKTKIIAATSTESTKQFQNPKSINIIFPAQLGTFEDYIDFANLIEVKTNIPTYIPSFKRLDWPIGLLPSVLSKDYFQSELKPNSTLSFYYKKIDECLQEGLRQYPNIDSVNIIGHSIGGWIARVWLSEWSKQQNYKIKVKNLITLGSPHNPPPQGSVVSSFDQTRGLLSYINTYYPGAYEPNVKYTSVISGSTTGSLLPLFGKNSVNDNKVDDRGDNAPSPSSSSNKSRLSLISNKDSIDTRNSKPSSSLPSSSTKTNTSSFTPENIEKFVAFISYFFLVGEGKVAGDGIIPVEASLLAGAQIIELKSPKQSYNKNIKNSKNGLATDVLTDQQLAVKHSNYVPTLGKSVRLPFLWYGSEEVIDEWLQCLYTK